MILKWNEQRMKVVPASKGEKVLYPGANDVDPADFKAMEPHIKMDISLGRIEVIQVKAAEGKVKPAEPKDLPLAEVKKMLKVTVSVDSVRAWLEDETRPDARVAMERRLAELEKELERGGAKANDDKGLE